MSCESTAESTFHFFSRRHRRGSELKFPLNVDQPNIENLGTVYIHQPIAQLVEQVEPVELICTAEASPSPEVNVLRKRIVNFDNDVQELAPASTEAKMLVPDLVRSSHNAKSPGSEEPKRPTATTIPSTNRKSTVRSADSSATDEEGDDGDAAEVHSPLDSSKDATSAQFTEGTTSAAEWIGITTNSEEENSYTSDLEASDSRNECSDYAGECDFAPTVILNPCCGTNDRSEFGPIILAYSIVTVYTILFR